MEEIIEIDLVVAVYNTEALIPLLGSHSIFASTPHLGTGKKVLGWEWDKGNWDFDFNENTGGVGLAPSLFDPDMSVLEDSFFQSGISGNSDLKVLSVARIEPGLPTLPLLTPPGPLPESSWQPVVKHGTYFIHRARSYLHSDGFITEFLASGVLWPGAIVGTTLPRIPLTEAHKGGIPIQVRSYKYLREEGRYIVDIEFRKKANFTGRPSGTGRLSTRAASGAITVANIDTTRPEFTVEQDTVTSLYSVVLNSSTWVGRVGIIVLAIADLPFLEEVGVVGGTASQIFQTLYSPIDRTQPLALKVYTYPESRDSFTTWTEVETITGPGQVEIDYDLGIIRFNATGGLPAAGHRVGVTYMRSVSVEYEPEWAGETVTPHASISEMNPVSRVSNRGFVFLRDQEMNPGSIRLFADTALQDAATDTYGPVNIGTSYLPIRAVVRAEFTSELLEGETVTFELLEDGGATGSFVGGTMVVTGLTDRDGTARAFYNPPSSINDIGRFTDNVTNLLSRGFLNFPGASLSIGDLTKVHVYKVFDSDPVLGKNLSGAPLGRWAQDWRDFFLTEGIDTQTGIADLDALAGGPPEALWEFRHRLIMGLLAPRAYNRELRNGKKQIVSIFDVTAINPNNGTAGAFRPLTPTRVSTVGADTVLEFAVPLDAPRLAPNNLDLDGYFVIVPPMAVRIRARVFNSRVGMSIESNTISLRLEVPPHMNGTILIEDINSLPANLVTWALTATHNSRILPLGFRLRSPGVTLASALGGVTYLNTN